MIQLTRVDVHPPPGISISPCVAFGERYRYSTGKGFGSNKERKKKKRERCQPPKPTPKANPQRPKAKANPQSKAKPSQPPTPRTWRGSNERKKIKRQSKYYPLGSGVWTRAGEREGKGRGQRGAQHEGSERVSSRPTGHVELTVEACHFVLSFHLHNYNDCIGTHDARRHARGNEGGLQGMYVFCVCFCCFCCCFFCFFVFLFSTFVCLFVCSFLFL